MKSLQSILILVEAVYTMFFPIIVFGAQTALGPI